MNGVFSIRGRLQITQQVLARELGCTQGNVGNYEAGKQEVPPTVARKLIDIAAARGLAISFDHVYGAAPLPEPRAADRHPPPCRARPLREGGRR